MAIYKPAIVQKSIPTWAGDLKHGAEIYLLHEDDYQHNNDPDYFRIKLAYIGIHHYLPIIPKGLTNYFDSHQNAMYFLKNARSALKNFHTQLNRTHWSGVDKLYIDASGSLLKSGNKSVSS